MKSINENVKMLIEYLGITPYEFSKQIGNKRADTIYNIINGKVEVSPTTLSKIIDRYPNFHSLILFGDMESQSTINLLIEKRKEEEMAHLKAKDDSESVQNIYYKTKYNELLEKSNNDLKIAKEKYIRLLEESKAYLLHIMRIKEMALELITKTGDEREKSLRKLVLFSSTVAFSHYEKYSPGILSKEEYENEMDKRTYPTPEQIDEIIKEDNRLQPGGDDLIYITPLSASQDGQSE